VKIVATGKPEEIAVDPKSFTGKYLKKVLKKGGANKRKK
jgi:excinuclease UvrABC ATPase subunit